MTKELIKFDSYFVTEYLEKDYRYNSPLLDKLTIGLLIGDCKNEYLEQCKNNNQATDLNIVKEKESFYESFRMVFSIVIKDLKKSRKLGQIYLTIVANCNDSLAFGYSMSRLFSHPFQLGNELDILEKLFTNTDTGKVLNSGEVLKKAKRIKNNCLYVKEFFELSRNKQLEMLEGFLLD